ncbi:GPI ethanolamine phosphate transferase 3 subunit O, partial [Phenoliferia sp. Uapishka_3]
MSDNVHPPPADPTAPRWPFDPETVAKHRAESTSATSSPSLPLAYRLRRHIHTLSFLSPSSFFILTLFLLSLLHAASLLLFTRGFLLTRQALPNVNDCTPISLTTGRLDPSCSLPPTHNKLVFIIIDALRADFVLPTSSPLSYQNHISLPSQLSKAHPTHSFLSHFIADAPTTTLQRIKGLTTGSLPTFIDAGSNFAGEKADEDNWLGQAKRAGKKVGLIGDETWLNVFPKGERESVWDESKIWAYDSFNVEDLDTVDAGVVEHLLPLLDANRAGTSDWDILIAHSLGLDHAGHRFGARHPETNRKLRETQKLLEDVADRLDEDTLLVVIGDHGMTDRGDHGGDSREELEAALWVYSKGAPLTDGSWFDHSTFSAQHPIANLFNASLMAEEYGDQMNLDWPEKGVRTTRSVAQVDLVPSISLLLGFPIPFGNLGLPIPELFFRESSLPSAPTAPGAPAPNPKKKPSFFSRSSSASPPPPNTDSLTPLQTLLQASLLTSSQLSHYLQTYTSLPTGSSLLPHMPELTFVLSLAQSAYRGAHASGANQEGMELRSLEKFWSYGRKAREKARGVWAKFDPVLMGAGIGVWVGSLVFGLRVVTATKNGNRARFIVGQAVEGGLGAGWMTVAGWLLGAFKPFEGLKPLFLVFITAAGVCVGALTSPWTPSSPFGTFGFSTRISVRQMVHLLPLLAHCAIFTSNSFTVFENSSVLFILSSILIITLLKSLSAPEIRLRNRLIGFTMAALVGVRLMAYSTICREEQIPKCHVTFHLGAGSWASLGAMGVAAVAAWFIPTMLRKSLALSASDTGVAPAYLSGGVRMFLLLGVGYWAVDWCIAGLGLDAAGLGIATVLKTGLARVVQVGAVLGSTLVWWYAPIPLRIQRETIKDGQGRDLRTQVKFIGFANSFGSSYLLFWATAFVGVWLVSSPPAQAVLTLYVGVLLCLLEIFDSERDVEHLRKSVTAASIQDLLSTDIPTVAPSHRGPNFLQISTIALLSHLAFFTTGHQASLSTIQWSTAFIGFPRLTYPFSPLLVLLNTLGPFLLASLSIPLFVFWNLSPTLRDQGPIALLRNLLKAGVSYSLYQAAVALSAAVWAGWFRRHLFVWKVFAPRFMLGGVTMLATDLAILSAMCWGALGTVQKAKATFGTKVVE